MELKDTPVETSKNEIGLKDSLAENLKKSILTNFSY